MSALSEFIRKVGKWWLLIVPGEIGSIIGYLNSVQGRTWFSPAVWVVIGLLGLLFAAFVAFKKTRDERDGALAKVESLRTKLPVLDRPRILKGEKAALLEVTNTGGDAEFEAQIRVEPGQWTLPMTLTAFWEKSGAGTSRIKPGLIDRIFVAELDQRLMARMTPACRFGFVYYAGDPQYGVNWCSHSWVALEGALKPFADFELVISATPSFEGGAKRYRYRVQTGELEHLVDIGA